MYSCKYIIKLQSGIPIRIHVSIPGLLYEYHRRHAK